MGRDDLINAVIDGDRGRVELLLAGGAYPNVADHAGWTPLHFAAQNNDAEIATLLLQHGASVSDRDEHGNTPLFRAAFSYRGMAECVTTLLAAGADPDAANDHGVSPRSLAGTIANYDTGRFFRDVPED
jgi:ankyrin repeat protein